MYKLKTIGAPYKQFPLKTGAYRLGSAPDSELCVEDPSVAAYHCEVVVTSSITVRDISPNHETYLDEKQIQTASLQPGQTLRLGNIKLVLEDEESEGSGAGSPSGLGKILSGTPSAREKRAQLYENVGLPLLVLLLLGGLAAWIYYSRQSPDAAKDKPSVAKQAPKKAEVAASAPSAGPAPAAPEQGSRARASAGAGVAKAQGAAQSSGRRGAGRGNGAPSAVGGAGPNLIQEIPEMVLTGPAAVLGNVLKEEQKSSTPGDPRVTKALGDLGHYYAEQGQFELAVPYLQRALTNLQAHGGLSPAEVAAALDDLGETYAGARQFNKASSLLEKGLDLRRAGGASTQLAAAVSLNNLAAVSAAQGDYSKSAKLLENTFKDFTETVDPGSPAMFSAMESLTKMHDAAGEHGRAETVAKAAVENAAATAGPQSAEMAKSLNNLARHYQAEGDHAQAKPLLEEAAKISEKALGLAHPQTEKLLDDLAKENACQEEPAKARQIAIKALKSKEELLQNLLLCGSERDLLAQSDELSPYGLTVFLGSAPEIAASAIHYKAALVDALLDLRQLDAISGNPDLSGPSGSLTEKREALSKLLFGSSGDASNETKQAEIVLLTGQVKQAVNEFMGQFAGFGRAAGAAEVTVDQVSQAIPKQAALVEFIRYAHCLGGGQWEPCYGAIVMAPGAEITWIPLGGASAIDRSVENFRAAEQKPSAKEESSAEGKENTGSPLAEALHSLHEQVWASIETALPTGTKTVVISPDGALNSVSFAALLTPKDEFLSQKFSFRYVTTGRDLLDRPSRARASAPIVVANPDFSQSADANANSGTAPKIRDANRRQLITMQLPKLSSLIEEGARVELLFRGRENEVNTFFGGQAGESQLSQAVSPKWVHLGTVGFFLPDDTSTTAQGSASPFSVVEGPGFLRMTAGGELATGPQDPIFEKKPLSNPLHRAGFALAGAEATFGAWSHNRTPPAAGDGVVTADELSQWHLDGTGLVVLSASDFRFGAARSGEAVLALRRAFIRAGAADLLLQFGARWDHDEANAALFDFYERFLKSGKAGDSLAEVQREKLPALRKSDGLDAPSEWLGLGC